MTKEVAGDAIVIAGIAGISFANLNEILTFIGLAIAIPIALCRLYTGFCQARDRWNK